MQDFETEEQQLEAIKKWWKENSSSILIGLAIGGFSLAGWTSYNESQYQHGIEASDMYISVLAQAETASLDLSTVDKLASDYTDTPYAALSALVVAKHEVDAGNMDKAVVQLQWVIANSVEEEVKDVARLRLARLMISQQQYDAAEKILTEKHATAFNALYEELKGDIHVAKGEIEQARIAYDKAIAGSENSNRWLQLKRQDLGASKLSNLESAGSTL